MAGVAGEAHRRIGSDRQGAGANRDMGLADADDIEEERDGEDRPAAADQAQHEPNQCAAAGAEKILDRFEQRSARRLTTVGPPMMTGHAAKHRHDEKGRLP